MKINDFNDSLLVFLRNATTPYHAVSFMRDVLVENEFKELKECDAWKLKAGGKYFVIRGDSSIAAFRYEDNLIEQGIPIAGAHTDSPSLKIKPSPELYQHSYLQLGVEVYGGALLNPWFDRELSIAGRLTYRSADGSIDTALIDFKRPVAIIPSLAIHLDREANKNKSINAQKDLPPVLLQCSDEKPKFSDLIINQMKEEGFNGIEEIISHDLFLYDVIPHSIAGLKNEFIIGPRLDNLISCFAGLQGIIDDSAGPAMVIFNDHEEVGSISDVGAQGPFLKSLMQRIAGNMEYYYRMIDASTLISMDNAHGVHPNFSDKYDANHGPLLNKGPVIKRNANQRYATVAGTEALYREIARIEKIPLQSFVVRSDMACGSTIGPLASAELGIKTIDVGVPTWAMHSIRETSGICDLFWLYRTIVKYFEAKKN